MTSEGSKLRAAALSVVSNSVLILLKAIAASVTGSVSIGSPALAGDAAHLRTDALTSAAMLARLPRADIRIHLEPEDRVRLGERL